MVSVLLPVCMEQCAVKSAVFSVHNCFAALPCVICMQIQKLKMSGFDPMILNPSKFIKSVPHCLCNDWLCYLLPFWLGGAVKADE